MADTGYTVEELLAIRQDLLNNNQQLVQSLENARRNRDRLELQLENAHDAINKLTRPGSWKVLDAHVRPDGGSSVIAVAIEPGGTIVVAKWSCGPDRAWRVTSTETDGESWSNVDWAEESFIPQHPPILST